MTISVDNIKRCIDRIKAVGFWGRLFGWGDVRRQLDEAATELERLTVRLEDLVERFNEQDKDLAGAEARIDQLREQVALILIPKERRRNRAQLECSRTLPKLGLKILARGSSF